MTTTQNEQIFREDGELVGLLKRTENDDWIPCTVFGLPISEPQPREDAEQYLYTWGLSILAEHWELREDTDWITVKIIEARPSNVTLRYVDYGHPDLFGRTRTLDTEDVGKLRMR